MNLIGLSFLLYGLIFFLCFGIAFASLGSENMRIINIGNKAGKIAFGMLLFVLLSAIILVIVAIISKISA